MTVMNVKSIKPPSVQSTGQLNCFIGKSFPCGAACFSMASQCQRILPQQNQNQAQVLKNVLREKSKSLRPGKEKDQISSIPRPLPVNSGGNNINNTPVKLNTSNNNASSIPSPSIYKVPLSDKSN